MLLGRTAKTLKAAHCYASAARSLTTMQMIKKLREETQAPLNIVKSAVSAATVGDYESALAALKTAMTKRGEKLVAKSAERTATEGWVIGARTEDGRSASISVLNCETDFVAKSDKVVSLASDIGLRLAESASKDDTGSVDYTKLSAEALGGIQVSDSSVQEHLTQAMSLFGETMRMSQAITTRSIPDKIQFIGLHCHGGPTVSQNIFLGRMGAMVTIQSGHPKTKELADEMAREVVAQNPDTIQEFWTLEKIGDAQHRTVRQWAGEDVDIVAWTRLER